MTPTDPSSTTAPIVAINDSDLSDHPDVESVLCRFDLAQHRFDLAAGWFADPVLQQSAAVIVHLDGAVFDWHDSLAALIQRHADLPILLVVERCHAEIAFSIAPASCVSFLPKPLDFDEFAGFIRHAIDRFHLKRFLQQTHHEFARSLAMLTERQKQVLKLLTTGMPNKTIANRIGVSQRTVEAERARILKTFNASSTADVVVRYGEYRILNNILPLGGTEDASRPSMLGLRHRSLHLRRADNPRSNSPAPVADSFCSEISAPHANRSSP